MTQITVNKMPLISMYGSSQFNYVPTESLYDVSKAIARGTLPKLYKYQDSDVLLMYGHSDIDFSATGFILNGADILDKAFEKLEASLEELRKEIFKHGIIGGPFLWDSRRKVIVSWNDFEVPNYFSSQDPKYFIYEGIKDGTYISTQAKTLHLIEKTKHIEFSLLLQMCHCTEIIPNCLSQAISAEGEVITATVYRTMGGVPFDKLLQENSMEVDLLLLVCNKLGIVEFDGSDTFAFFDELGLDLLSKSANTILERQREVEDAQEESRNFAVEDDITSKLSLSEVLEVGLDNILKRVTNPSAKLEITIDLDISPKIKKMFLHLGAAFVKPESLQSQLIEYEEALHSSNIYFIS